MTKSKVLWLSIAASLVVGPARAADTKVVLLGCVLPGTEPGTYLLSGSIQGDPHASPDDTSASLYWLSSTKGLKENVNTQVEVVGTIDAETHTTATAVVDANRAKAPRGILELDNGSQAVRAATDSAVLSDAQEKVVGRPVGTSGVIEVKRPLRELKVHSVNRVAPTCPDSSTVGR